MVVDIFTDRGMSIGPWVVLLSLSARYWSPGRMVYHSYSLHSWTWLFIFDYRWLSSATSATPFFEMLGQDLVKASSIYSNTTCSSSARAGRSSWMTELRNLARAVLINAGGLAASQRMTLDDSVQD